MNPRSYSQILDASAAQRIPDTVDLTNRILSRVGEGQAFPMRPKMQAATILLLVVVAMLALTTIAYAVYRFLGDPGLQSVQDAGLVTPVYITAQPTLLPTSTPAVTPQTAFNLALSQTLEGTTLTVNWVYLDEGRLALGMTFTDLPQDILLEMPKIDFHGAAPAPVQGTSQSVQRDENQMVFVSYQVIQAYAAGETVDLGVDVPLARAGLKATRLGNFHFDLKNVPVVVGQVLPIQQTYTVKRNGVEVRLKSVQVTPAATEVIACYDFPTQTAPFWFIQNATVQPDNGPEESYRQYQDLLEIKDDHCVKMDFATGSAKDAKQLMFRVRQLAVPTAQGEKLEGPWEFYVDLPSQNIIPGRAAPTPTPTAAPTVLGTQTISGVTLTLDWIFADAKRIAFRYTLSGLPEIPDATALSGMVVVKDEQGKPVGGVGGGGSSSVQRVAGRPGTLTGTRSIVMLEPLTQSSASFSIDMTLDGSQGYDWNRTIAAFEIPPSATPFPPGVLPPALPNRLVGTFHFDVQTTIYPLTVIEPNQTVTANGIAMRLARAEITPSYAQFTLCYLKPTAKDWMLGEGVKLKDGAYEAKIHSYRLLIDPDMGGVVAKSPKNVPLPTSQPGERCVQIDFLLGQAGPAQNLILTIPVLEQSTPEVIPAAEMKAAQQKLKAQGIEMDYTTSTSAGGGGGGGPIFSRKPEGMSDSEVYQKYLMALGYLYPGPWEFKLDIP